MDKFHLLLLLLDGKFYLIYYFMVLSLYCCNDGGVWSVRVLDVILFFPLKTQLLNIHIHPSFHFIVTLSYIT